MSKITTDLADPDTRAQVETKLKAIMDAYGVDYSAFTNYGQIRSAMNALIEAAGDVANGSSWPTFKAQINTYWNVDPVTGVFGASDDGFYYDPSDLSTLFQDSAMTTPVTATGDPVGAMMDKSGNVRHLLQSTSAARPVYRTDGTFHWLEFNGTSQWMLAADLDFPADHTIVIGAQHDTGIGAEYLYGLGVITAWAIRMQNGDYGALTDASGWSNLTTDPTQDTTTKHVLSLLYDKSASITPYWNGGVLTASGLPVTSTPSGGFTLGSGETDVWSGGWNGNFYGGAGINRLLTAGERGTFENFAASRAGVTLV